MAVPPRRAFPPARIAALAVITLVVGGMVFLRVGQNSEPISVPAGAKAGLVEMSPCQYATENGGQPADCGTLVVPENRHNPRSRLIALPVTRIRAKSSRPAEPIFHFIGGPGQSNMKFPQASRLTAHHDVVIVGYRGVDGSSRLDCPEVTSALEHSDDLLGQQALHAYANGFRECAKRLTRDGVDLAGYSIPELVDDMEAARVALGYGPIDLESESAGTRTAMIYSWRYPASIHRSVMIGVNPPGHFLWNPRTTDTQLAHLSRLCAQDTHCRQRTGDLAASMRQTASSLPDRWLFLPIKKGNVRLASFFGLFDSVAAPPNLPVTVDSWLAAANGDPSGFWFLSVLSDLLFAPSFVWGEDAAMGLADAGTVNDYFAAHPREERDTILGNPGTTWIWGSGELAKAWPAAPDATEYSQVRTSRTDTLLIGGTNDFTAPPQNATTELLPSLPNGHQVVLSELGHVPDFWAYQPEAGEKLINTYFDTGRVDQSGFTHATVNFTPGVSYPTLAKIALGALIGLALLTVVSLALMARRVRRRDGFGRVASAVLRSLYAVVLGLGGWCLGALVVLTALPSVPVNDPLLSSVAAGVPVGLGVYLAWARREESASARTVAAVTATVCAVVGAWLGFEAVAGFLALVTTIIGGVLGANVALLAIDMVQPWLRTVRMSVQGTSHGDLGGGVV